MRANLGSCDRHFPGFVSVDIAPGPGVDIVADLTKPWPFGDSELDEVLAFDVFEHLSDKRHTMNELWRCCKPGAKVTLQIPHATEGDGGHCDPTHCSYWTPSDFEYYHPGIAERERFRNSPYYAVKADFRVASLTMTEYKRHWGGRVVEMLVVLECVK